MIAKILKCFSNLTIKDISEKNAILKTVENLFQLILNDKNPIVKQRSLETFNYFAHTTTHVEILTQIVGSNENLQDEVSNFLRRFIKKNNKISNEYFKNQNIVRFEHRCEVVTRCVEPQKKKVKLSTDQSINIDLVLQRLYTEVDTILEFYKNNAITDNHREKLIKIISQLNNVI